MSVENMSKEAQVAFTAIRHFKSLKAQTAFGADRLARKAFEDQKGIVTASLKAVKNPAEIRALQTYFNA